MSIKGLVLGLGLLGAGLGLTGCERMEDSPMTTGAVLGAGSGALLGSAIGHDTRGAITGGAAGALLGTGAGYLYEQNQEHRW